MTFSNSGSSTYILKVPGWWMLLKVSRVCVSHPACLKHHGSLHLKGFAEIKATSAENKTFIYFTGRCEQNDMVCVPIC